MDQEKDKLNQEQEIEITEEVEKDPEGSEELVETDISQSAMAVDAVSPEKRTLNKTLIIVGAIVLIAVIAMAFFMIKDYVFKPGAPTNEAAFIVPVGTISPDGAYNAGETIKIDSNFYKIYLNATKQQAEYSNGLTTAAKKNAYWADAKNLDLIKKQALDQIAQGELLAMKAKTDGLTLTAAEIETAKSQITDKAIQSFKTLDKVDSEIMKIYGVNFEEFKRFIVYQTLISKENTEWKAQIQKTITDKVAKAYYQKNIKTYQFTKIRHILFTTTTTMKPAQVAAAKKKAQAMLKRVRAGENMAALAVKFSQDPSAKDSAQAKGNKGIIEVQATSQLVKEFLDWSLKSKKGATGIVKSQFGFHVMKNEGTSVKTYKATKAEIITKLVDEALKAAMDKFFATAPNTYSNLADFDRVTLAQAFDDPTPEPGAGVPQQ